MSSWQFVDSITASPTVRLDINSATGGLMLADEPDISPPQLRRATVTSMLADGELIPAAAYANRIIRLPLQLLQTSVDAAADKLQALARELTRRPGNFLRVTVGSSPVFFSTFPAPDAAYRLMVKGPQRGTATLEIPCGPFGLGLEETLPAVTVYNDPAEGATLNANPYFETDVSSWTFTGTSFVRSTAQLHEGVASGFLTPDGVSSGASASAENVPATEGVDYWASAWVRCAVARNVTVNINWRTAAGSLISVSSGTTAVLANTWTLLRIVATAPATTAQLNMSVSMSTTPPASNTLFIDEARVRRAGSSGAMYLDIASPKGDVETPLYLQLGGTLGTGGGGGQGRRNVGITVRRRGTPSNLPLVLQAENMTQGTDTTVQANSALFSGGGTNNFSRCTFVTGAMSTRLSGTWPPTAGTDMRGTYRAFVRLRQNTSADLFDVRLQYGVSGYVITNSDVRLPADSGPGAPTIKYVDLGLMQIPVGYDPVTDGLSGVELAAQGAFVAVGARRVSGSGSVDFDHVLFVPTDDRGLMLVRLPEIQTTASDTYMVEGGYRPAVYCLNVSGQLVSGQQPEISGVGQMLTPGRSNRVYLFKDLGTEAALTGSGDDVTGTMTVTPSYWPRYLFPLRPVST